MVRGFLVHLKAFEPETEIPSPGLVAEARRPQAHLYSPEQINRMMEAGHHWFWEPGSFRQATYRTVIGLLASTGLRIGEALRLMLDQAHLDHDPPYLEIRDTKFHKSRLVPLHPTAADKLKEYLLKEEGPGCQGPALHALRHSFAVARLLAWYRAGGNVRTQLPNLSVYMGHWVCWKRTATCRPPRSC